MEPISVSRVQAYLACPLQYRFRYVDRIPPPWRPAALAFGTSVHAAIEWFHRERLAGRRPAPDDVVRIFEADWEAANVEPLVFSERDSKEALFEKGRGMVALFVENQENPPVAVEERFEVDLVDPVTGEVFDLRLRGIIDLMEEDGTLVDLKTAARTLSDDDLERHLQLTTYALASFLQTGDVPPLRLDILLKTKVPKLVRKETRRSMEDLSWTAHLIRAVSGAVAAEQFFPSPSWRCSECEYFAHCQRWRC